LVEGHAIHESQSSKPCEILDILLSKNDSSQDTRRRHYIMHACILERNLPAQVMLSLPVVVYDALDGCFPFHIEWISDIATFKVVMEARARNVLEDRFKEAGSAKIRAGEFIIQDLDSNRKFSSRQPWDYIMRPGKKRHMSVIFKDSDSRHQSCPHCGINNASNEGQPTTCVNCEATYERILGLNTPELDIKSGRVSNHLIQCALGRSSHNPDLQFAFRRLVLMSSLNTIRTHPHTIF